MTTPPPPSKPKKSKWKKSVNDQTSRKTPYEDLLAITHVNGEDPRRLDESEALRLIGDIPWSYDGEG